MAVEDVRVRLRRKLEEIGSYSNLSLVARIQTILAGQRDDRPSSRSPESRQLQRRLSAEHVAQLVEAYEEGATQQELAARFGMYPTSIYYWLRKQGVQLRPRAG